MNRILKKVKKFEIWLKFQKIRDKQDVIIVGVGNASFKKDRKAIRGVLLFLANSTMTRAAAIY